jgi:hypothetical protein
MLSDAGIIDNVFSKRAAAEIFNFIQRESSNSVLRLSMFKLEEYTFHVYCSGGRRCSC